MTQTLKSIVMKAAFIALLLTPFLVPAVVDAQSIQQNLCAGINLDATTTCDPAAADGEAGVQKLITNIINVFSLVVGVIAVVMIIIGGLKYITSSGDSNNVTSAKNTILYAIIGLVIVAMSQFIVRFVLSRATA